MLIEFHHIIPAKISVSAMTSHWLALNIYGITILEYPAWKNDEEMGIKQIE
jgi:hypothetical protein